MTDLGIPIPRVKPNAIFCAGCGETGTHADTCPSRFSPTATATAGDVSLLRGMISAWIERGQAVNKRLDALEADVAILRGMIEACIEHGQYVNKRLDAPEAKRKK